MVKDTQRWYFSGPNVERWRQYNVSQIHTPKGDEILVNLLERNIKHKYTLANFQLINLGWGMLELGIIERGGGGESVIYRLANFQT